MPLSPRALPIVEAIPQPRALPLVGNLLDLSPTRGILGLSDLADVHGPIYRMALPAGETVFISSQELVDEVCDETRFGKKLHGPLKQVKDFTGDSLFTLDTDHQDWGKAHRILMPAFGPAALKDMFEDMADIAEQLMVKWERLGPQYRVDVADSTTRLTLDTIALCSFSYRFNSLYSHEMHPFVESMVRALKEASRRGLRHPLQQRMMVRTRHRYDEDKRVMYELADRLIAERRRQPLPQGRRDILDTMLEATDPQTGEKLSDENVRYQLVTFLIAGHETTSGMLSFTLYELLRNPHVLARARAQVDEVLGERAPRFEDLRRLGYLDQILKESLRLWPTAPAFAVQPHEDTVIGGRYPVTAGQTLMVLSFGLHRDPVVWGADAESFDPDRFSPERSRSRPPNSWKPFGNGQRSCIGRGFALQEASLFLAMLLQRFDLTAADPHYRLKIPQTVTFKPEGFHVHLRRRSKAIQPNDAVREATASRPVVADHGAAVRLLYGSKAGTAKAFAQRLAHDARRRGYSPTISPLDEAVGQLPRDGAVIVVSSSYEGMPPDNARDFHHWVQTLPAQSLRGVRFAVFGCGNTDWARTYQAVPKALDEHLGRAGAHRLIPRGEANARADLFGDFEQWCTHLWEPMAAAVGATEREPEAGGQLEVELLGAVRDPLLRQHRMAFGTVMENRELTEPGADVGSKRHVEISLPEGMTYRAGDYLSVLPLNPPAVVRRALGHFGLAYDTTMVLRTGEGAQTFLPVGTAVSTGDLLMGYVELAQPATRRDLHRLAQATACPPHAADLKELADDFVRYEREILEPRVSVLDLLERFPSCDLGLADYLQMLRALTPRQYSVSSSPRADPQRASLTFAVVREPARSGHGTFEGTASNYLAHTRPGSRVALRVQQPNSAFRPPASVTTPAVMICAGTGLAPMRAFLQDRELQAREEGTIPGPTALFFGCRHPEADHLYRQEISRWVETGLVELYPAFSTAPVEGITYVQDALWAARQRVIELVTSGATVYVCGDGRSMAPAVHETCLRLFAEATGVGARQAQKWLARMERQGRYVVDVFA